MKAPAILQPSDEIGNFTQIGSTEFHGIADAAWAQSAEMVPLAPTTPHDLTEEVLDTFTDSVEYREAAEKLRSATAGTDAVNAVIALEIAVRWRAYVLGLAVGIRLARATEGGLR